MKFLSLVAASALLATTASLAVASSQDEEMMLFDSFITKFDKPYKHDSVERAKRFAIFKKNLVVAAEQQKKNPHAQFGINKFSDLSAGEFKRFHNAEGYYANFAKNVQPKLAAAKQPSISIKDAGFQIDWRTKGAVTPVKNQGQCGSCWAFSTTGNLEGQWFLAGHPLTSLSEEFFVDCDTVDQGCNGGLPSQAVLNWLIPDWPQGRVPTEASYPYVAGGGQAGTCKKTGWVVGGVFQGGRNVVQNEGGMWGTLYGDGPISIGVDATTWQTYSGGIMTNCPAGQLDHGVLIVGGNLEYHIPYWIIKNSWGANDWGENGYIRVQYGTNQCGLTEAPFMGIVNNATAPTPAPMPPTPAPTLAPPTPVPPPSPEPAGWVNLWPPGPMNQLSMAMGLSALGPRDVYVAGMVQGSGSDIGSQVAHFDGQTEGNFNFLQASGLPFMEMEMAIGGQPGFPKGAVCGVMFPLIDKSPFSYIANTTTVLGSSMPSGSFMSVVQGCANSPDGNYIFGADQGSTNANMRGLLSTNGGVSFDYVPFGNVAIAQPNCTFPRYATIASEKVMYVTLGDWGSNNSGVSAHYENMAGLRDGKQEWKTTATRKIVRDAKTGKTTRVSTGPMEVFKSYHAADGAAASTSGSSSGYCGNSAEIIRTADGGKTWTNVFSSVDRFYFNEISCFDETHCLAVGEGFDEDAGVRIYRTADGTNWERVFFMASTNERAYSFFSVEVANSFTGEAWVGGTYQLPDQQAGGLLFHTTDFGKTWSEYKHQIPSLVEITQISCAPNSFGQQCFATAMTTFQTSTILRYDRTPVGPGPHPAQSYFTQKTCVTSACNVLCQSIEFPQNMCLQANQGSVLAQCSGNNLVQSAFDSTDCTGKSKQSEVPLNKCLSGSNGYFEFSCGTNSSSKASNFHAPRRMFNKNDKVRTL